MLAFSSLEMCQAFVATSHYQPSFAFSPLYARFSAHSFMHFAFLMRAFRVKVPSTLIIYWFESLLHRLSPLRHSRAAARAFAAFS